MARGQEIHFDSGFHTLLPPWIQTPVRILDSAIQREGPRS